MIEVRRGGGKVKEGERYGVVDNTFDGDKDLEGGGHGEGGDWEDWGRRRCVGNN